MDPRLPVGWSFYLYTDPALTWPGSSQVLRRSRLPTCFWWHLGIYMPWGPWWCHCTPVMKWVWEWPWGEVYRNQSTGDLQRPAAPTPSSPKMMPGVRRGFHFLIRGRKAVRLFRHRMISKVKLETSTAFQTYWNRQIYAFLSHLL